MKSKMWIMFFPSQKITHVFAFLMLADMLNNTRSVELYF